MRLHTLTFQAVGPYPERHTIDFARLGASGLYLLEGPTGAGKSTIIDAIVYALYGKVAADAASDDRLRSTHVGPGTESYVDLVLETGAGIYRVRRSPAYDRPKQRGTGTTRQQATAKLWELSTTDLDALDLGRDLGDQTPGTFLSGRADEVGTEMTRIVGLTREQLVQTIVLPQGEFASFLRARPEDRSTLLQKVFGTEIYQRVQSRLVDARKTALASRKDSDAQIALAAAAFASSLDEAAADELRALAAAPDSSEALVALVTAHLSRLETEHSLALDARDTATAAHAEREGVARLARSSLALVTRRESAAGRLTELEARAEQQAHDVARLAAARRAAGVVARLDDVEKTTTAHVAAAHAHDDVLASAREHPVVAALLAAPDADAAVLAAARSTAATKLEHLVDLEAGLTERAATLEKRVAAVARQRATAEADAAALAARPTERAALAKRLGEAQQGAALVPQREADHTAALAVRRAVDALARHDQRIAEADTVLSNRLATATSAVEREAALRLARIDGIAGELARDLVDGEPCVVCGSTEHPAPAPLGDDHVSPEQVEAAADARAAAEAQAQEARDARSALDAERAALVERTGGLDATAADAAVDAAALALAAATAAAHDVETLAQEIAAHDAATAALRTTVDAARDATTTAEASIDAERATLVADTDKVAAARAEHAAPDAEPPTLAAVHDDLVEQERLLAAVAAARTAARLATEALDAARTALADALAEAELSSADEARAAVLDRTSVQALESSTTLYEQQVAAERAALAEPEIAALPADVDTPTATAALEAAEAALDETRERRDAAVAAAATADDALTRARSGAADVVAAVTAAAGIHASTAPVIRMANLADASTSDNAAALTLSTYVLARRFDEVLDAANDRLRQMSSGRYELRRSDAKEKGGGRRLGLALRVRDHSTEDDREPTTLSGGETFYVSLCLALGLADVVTAEAGGIDLGTLFVDEGFGSLDPDTLELVMTELSHLQAGGRTVGVVSHVDAMKQAIADRISVRRRPDGSSTLDVVAGV
ncbi:AAA family ATPase [Flavimobilis sp. GY10621]|uniref:Nuclease SbcCD subunit C n=1 Tax=Flavimobilis rhizosphaerae TaxID=2775421 RepID=A0ABR9DQ87_9MICO|nr:AAA family ATPase [Flavimobilis rhizosphaerae]MBD9699285.1 AAA family ATPase [Flavimobilis rhizosphaerae]